MADTPEAAALDPDLTEVGRLLFAGPVAFERGVADMRDLPPAVAPEIAFAGRSNVGKSSLINALTGRKGLARASGEPGRTRELNLFDVGGRLRLVDMPGYGYAKAPKREIERWTALVVDYLRGRPGLARVFLLIDARHGLKPNDEAVMRALTDAAVVYQVVLTKADKPSLTALAAVAEVTRARLAKEPAAYPEVLCVSAQTGAGLAALRAAIAPLALPKSR